MLQVYWNMRYIVFCVCNFIESYLAINMYYKYLVICVILIITVPTIMTSKSDPTTLRPMMTSTCVISGNAILIAERWFAKHDADARYQGEQYLYKNIYKINKDA